MIAMQDMLIPLFKDIVIPFSAIPLGLGFIIATYFVLAGSSNAVNLTDGLDGLVILPVVLVAAGLGVLLIFLARHILLIICMCLILLIMLRLPSSVLP